MPRPRLARPSTDKQAVNLTIAARLEDALRQAQRERWLEENAAGMAAYNAQVDEHDVFADTLRSF